MHDKYTNRQYADDPFSCRLCLQGPNTREHLLTCQNSALCNIRQKTEQSIATLPFEQMLLESTNVSYDIVSNIRGILTRNTHNSHLTRIGLFSKQEVQMMCQELESLNISEHIIKAIRIDLIIILKIISAGLHALINFRNNHEYNSKEMATTSFNDETHLNQKLHKSRFNEIKPLEMDAPQIITYRIIHNFPLCTSYLLSPSLGELNENIERHLGLKGTLHDGLSLNKDFY